MWVDYFSQLTWWDFLATPADVIIQATMYADAKDMAIATKLELQSKANDK